MNMWVMIQLLVSCMQNKMGCGLKLARRAELPVQGSPGGAEQQVIKRLAVAEDQAR